MVAQALANRRSTGEHEEEDGEDGEDGEEEEEGERREVAPAVTGPAAWERGGGGGPRFDAEPKDAQVGAQKQGPKRAGFILGVSFVKYLGGSKIFVKYFGGLFQSFDVLQPTSNPFSVSSICLFKVTKLLLYFFQSPFLFLI